MTDYFMDLAAAHMEADAEFFARNPEGGCTMIEKITKYRLVNGKGEAADYLFDNYTCAETAAKKEGSAIEALHFDLAQIKLAWTPDDSQTWPPLEKGAEEDAQ